MNEETLRLVKAACRGDTDAFASLAEEHRRVAASIAYGILNDTHLAADAVQDAFLKAFQRLEQLKDPAAYSSWFLNIVRSTAIDMVRRRTRWGTREVTTGDDREAEIPSGPSAGPGPVDGLVQREDAVRIRDAVAALPPEYREVILLKHLEGRSYREIAQLLKTSVRAVESRLFRARQQLHKHLRARDVAPARSKTDTAPDASAQKRAIQAKIKIVTRSRVRKNEGRSSEDNGHETRSPRNPSGSPQEPNRPRRSQGADRRKQTRVKPQ